MKRSKLKDLTLHITDGEHATVVDTPNAPYYLLSNKNIVDGNIVITKEDRTISKITFDKINRRTLLDKGDVVVSTVGTIGKVALIKNEPNFEFQRSVGIIKCNSALLLPEYLMYYLNLSFVQNRLKRLSKGAVQKCLFINDLEDFIIDYPESIEKQKGIVKSLINIDSQIERNNAMVQKLQVLGNTIYSKTFSSCKDKISFYDYPYLELLKLGILQFDGEKTYIPTAEVNGNNINFNSSKITFENRENRANMQPICNSIWFAKMKSSNKHIYLTEKDNYLVDNFIFSTGFFGIKCQDFAFEYLIGTVELPYFEEMKDKLAHGATMESINNDDLKSLLIPNPSKELLEQYHNQTKDIYKQISLIRIENYKLEILKNRLLPLLINGQLEV